MRKVLTVHRGYYKYPQEQEDFVDTAPVQMMEDPSVQQIWDTLQEGVSMAAEVRADDGKSHVHVWIADE